MRFPQVFLTTALGVAILVLGACGGDDSPTGPSGDGGGGRDFDVFLYADLLSVQMDCDASTASPSAAAGDFFIRTELRSVVGEASTVIGSTDYELVQAHDGEAKTLAIRAAGAFHASSDARLEASVSIYENDPDRRHFDQTDTMVFAYDFDTSCWVYAGDDVCLRASGDVTTGVVRVRDGSGDPCAVDLSWRFRASPR